MIRTKSAVVLLLGLRCCLLAQTDPPADPAPSGPTAWKTGQLSISGALDAVYDFGLNHPADHTNQLLNFDDKANQLELNMATVTLDYAPTPVGFHVDAGAGRAFDIMGATEKDAVDMRYFQQAYVDVKPPAWHGVELDFGRFVTFAGAEVISTWNNWNYSRSLLFVWCTPYYNFGVRATSPVGSHFNTGVELVAGWNNILTGATYKTVGWTGAWAPNPKVTWTNTYYGGPDENTSNRGLRNLYDTVLLLAPAAKTSLYVNFDYLRDSPRYSAAYQVYGIAGAAKYQVSKKFSVSPRLEWLNDDSGMATGTVQRIKEFTWTGTYALLDRLACWVEFRNDWSNRPFFARGHEPASARNQPTALVGLIAFIGPNRTEP